MPELCIVIDDLGLRRNAHDPFLAIRGLRGVLAWAILPGGVHSVAIARELVELDEALLLHMPMEPLNPAHIAPHLGAYLQLNDSVETIHRRLSAAFETFPADVRPHIRGINNHQGSRLTASHAHMLAVAERMRRRGGYVLDSKTAPQSVLASTARALGVPSIARDVFIDNVRDVESIHERLLLAEDAALASGRAVAIGHPYPETAQALAHWMRVRNRSVRLVSLGKVMRDARPTYVSWGPSDR